MTFQSQVRCWPNTRDPQGEAGIPSTKDSGLLSYLQHWTRSKLYIHYNKQTSDVKLIFVVALVENGKKALSLWFVANWLFISIFSKDLHFKRPLDFGCTDQLDFGCIHFLTFVCVEEDSQSVSWYFVPSQPQRLHHSQKQCSICLPFTLHASHQTTN